MQRDQSDAPTEELSAWTDYGSFSDVATPDDVMVPLKTGSGSGSRSVRTNGTNKRERRIAELGTVAMALFTTGIIGYQNVNAPSSVPMMHAAGKSASNNSKPSKSNNKSGSSASAGSQAPNANNASQTDADTENDPLYTVVTDITANKSSSQPQSQSKGSGSSKSSKRSNSKAGKNNKSKNSRNNKNKKNGKKQPNKRGRNVFRHRNGHGRVIRRGRRNKYRNRPFYWRQVNHSTFHHNSRRWYLKEHSYWKKVPYTEKK